MTWATHTLYHRKRRKAGPLARHRWTRERQGRGVSGGVGPKQTRCVARTPHNTKDSMVGKNLEQRAADMMKRQNSLRTLKAENTKLARENRNLREELKQLRKQLRERTNR